MGMKKRYFIIGLALITTIAYFDLIDSCKKIDKVISSMIELEAQVKKEVDYGLKTSGIIEFFKTQK